ncbi:MAG: 16S rRNA (adenine(1518)-N(6)/adenine(1519)-N(6))-dimethyltransferase RsmA [Minisyncoccia bacterium]
MRAKKSLGQHWLKSERALSVIVEAGEVSKGDVVLEIGPGNGVLTEKLLATGARVVAVEKDDDLFKFLSQKFEKEISNGKLELVHDDILNLELKIENYKLIANIPYNITGAILKKFLGAERQPETIVLLVQKEVAQRIVAQDDKESILSISVKVYGKPRYVETVKAGSFAPMPSVDSAIIAIENISKDFFNRGSSASTVGEERFFEMVRAGFKSKRKKLSSNLSVIFDKEKVKKTFQKLNLDDNLRAEDVGIETWQKLTKNLI